jgi:hypothetical protein
LKDVEHRGNGDWRRRHGRVNRIAVEAGPEWVDPTVEEHDSCKCGTQDSGSTVLSKGLGLECGSSSAQRVDGHVHMRAYAVSTD